MSTTSKPEPFTREELRAAAEKVREVEALLERLNEETPDRILVGFDLDYLALVFDGAADER